MHTQTCTIQLKNCILGHLIQINENICLLKSLPHRKVYSMCDSKKQQQQKKSVVLQRVNV